MLRCCSDCSSYIVTSPQPTAATSRVRRGRGASGRPGGSLQGSRRSDMAAGVALRANCSPSTSHRASRRSSGWPISAQRACSRLGLCRVRWKSGEMLKAGVEIDVDGEPAAMALRSGDWPSGAARAASVEGALWRPVSSPKIPCSPMPPAPLIAHRHHCRSPRKAPRRRCRRRGQGFRRERIRRRRSRSPRSSGPAVRPSSNGSWPSCASEARRCATCRSCSSSTRCRPSSTRWPPAWSSVARPVGKGSPREHGEMRWSTGLDPGNAWSASTAISNQLSSASW